MMARWYFDFISPFSYLQFQQLNKERAKNPGFELEPVPVLFAGLLQHHQHKGPAEIPAKRAMTYRYCDWYAKQNNIEFHTPAAHPFNPLPFLRLAVAHNCDWTTIEKLFRHIWADSGENESFHTLESLIQLDGFENAAELVAQEKVKSTLKQNTEQAIARGVFGVPTIEYDNELFWGMDMTEMALAWINDPDSIADTEYLRLGTLPVAKARSNS